jgi:hypothetical protein
MSDEKKLIKLRFAELDPKTEPDPKNPGQQRDRKQSPAVEIANGFYRRVFKADEQPFEAVGVTRKDGERTVVDMTPEEEAGMLVRTGNFVLVEEEKQESGGGSQESGAAAKKTLGKIGGAPADVSTSV